MFFFCLVDKNAYWKLYSYTLPERVQGSIDFAISTNFLAKERLAGQCREWFARFKSCILQDLHLHYSLEDITERDWQTDFDDQALIVALEEEQSMTTSMLAEDFSVSQSTIVFLLKRLGKVWKLAGSVPHELSDNKVERVRIFTKLLQKNEHIFLRISLLATNRCCSSKTSKERRFAFRRVKPRKEYHNMSTVRKQCGVWWDRSGIIHSEIISVNGHLTSTVTSTLLNLISSML